MNCILRIASIFVLLYAAYDLLLYIGIMAAINILGAICFLSLSLLKWESLPEVKISLVAMKNAVLGNMGVHKIYKPGWKPAE